MLSYVEDYWQGYHPLLLVRLHNLLENNNNIKETDRVSKPEENKKTESGRFSDLTKLLVLKQFRKSKSMNESEEQSKDKSTKDKNVDLSNPHLPVNVTNSCPTSSQVAPERSRIPPTSSDNILPVSITITKPTLNSRSNWSKLFTGVQPLNLLLRQILIQLLLREILLKLVMIGILTEFGILISSLMFIELFIEKVRKSDSSIN